MSQCSSLWSQVMWDPLHDGMPFLITMETPAGNTNCMRMCSVCVCVGRGSVWQFHKKYLNSTRVGTLDNRDCGEVYGQESLLLKNWHHHAFLTRRGCNMKGERAWSLTFSTGINGNYSGRETLAEKLAALPRQYRVSWSLHPTRGRWEWGRRGGGEEDVEERREGRWGEEEHSIELKCSSQGKPAALTLREHLGVRLLCSLWW